MIIVNFKIYQETFGDKAIRLAEICKKVAGKTGVRIVVAASAISAWRIQKEVGIEVFLQNVDEYPEGKHSGFVSPIEARELGIKGALLNHSEHKKPLGTLRKIVKNEPKEFELVLCVHSLGQAEKWKNKIRSGWVAYEPSYLIASEDKSVSSEEPETIRKFVGLMEKIPVLVGAGIKNENDVKTALKMGAKGILVASNVVLAAEPEKELLKLAGGFGV